MHCPQSQAMAQQIAVRVLEVVDDESHRRVVLAAPRECDQGLERPLESVVGITALALSASRPQSTGDVRAENGSTIVSTRP